MSNNPMQMNAAFMEALQRLRAYQAQQGQVSASSSGRAPGMDDTEFDENGVRYPEAERARRKAEKAAQQNSGKDPGVGVKDPRYFDENGLPITPGGGQASDPVPYGGNGYDGAQGNPGAAAPNPYAVPAGNNQTDASYWEKKMQELRQGGKSYIDPSSEWGDDRWKQSYHTNDTVEVKADGNPHFGQVWDPNANGGQGGFVDMDHNDERAAGMFAESQAWDPEFQKGLQEAWYANDETSFQRWRNLARANNEAKWKVPASAAKPTEVGTPSGGGGGGGGNEAAPPEKPKDKKSVGYKPADPYKIKQSPIY